MTAATLATKFSDVAKKAGGLQAETGTTASSLDQIQNEHKTTRTTLSLLLVSQDGKTVVVYREPTPKKSLEDATKHRLAVWGGGMESTIEAQEYKKFMQDPTEYKEQHPDLLNDDGTWPADFWYRYQGEMLLKNSSMVDMGYPTDPSSIAKATSTNLQRILGAELGAEALPHIQDPILLPGEPMVTHVLNRKFGNHGDKIAAKHGLKVNERGELSPTGITVEERFLLCKLLIEPEDFQKIVGEGKAVVFTWEELLALAQRDTASANTWKDRLSHQDNPRELSIRNHSLLVNAQRALEYLAEETWFQRTWQRLFGKKLA